MLRRQLEMLLPNRGTREYRAWIKGDSVRRSRQYINALEPGLLSLVTAVWDGSPLPYFKQLAQSITLQMEGGCAQWFILANGCKRPELLAYLAHLEEEPFITVGLAGTNTGIIGGLRQCLERATGTYILPVDADDQLYPDALRIVTAHIQQNGYPPLLYTDEDKVSGRGVYQPYFKPDWDPVLLANSAYIAHLGVIDRRLALDLGAYSDRSAEGSPDWDLFTRFANAGYSAVHIPEVVYSWRIHAQSTADDAAAKPYIRSSQEAVLQRFLSAQAAGEKFQMAPSPLFGAHAAHLCMVRSAGVQENVSIVREATTLDQILDQLLDLRRQFTGQPFVAILGAGVEVSNAGWLSEALGMFELFPDAVMVGGRIFSREGLLIEAPRVFGFCGAFGSPDAGRKRDDPGYFGQAWKHRSVSAVGARLSVIRTAELQRVLEQLPGEATLQNLGCWIGAEALRGRQRVIYNPYLEGVESAPPYSASSAAEEKSFQARYAELLPDRRFYPEPFSLNQAYRIL